MNHICISYILLLPNKIIITQYTHFANTFLKNIFDLKMSTLNAKVFLLFSLLAI